MKCAKCQKSKKNFSELKANKSIISYGGVYMFYSTDCNYIVKIIGKDSHIECYTKEQLKNNIRHENGCIVYKVLNDGQLEKMAVIKPCK